MQPPYSQLQPAGEGVRMCAHAQVRRVGDENNICRHECQHMGVAVADRCLTEEVREGPGFPGWLLCSLPIAQRNTLSEEQREKGKGGGGRDLEGGGGAKGLFPQALDAGDPAEEQRITK